MAGSCSYKGSDNSDNSNNSNNDKDILVTTITIAI